MTYSVFSLENDELVDVLELTDLEAQSFKKANPELYLEIFDENSENPLDIFDPFIGQDDFYE